MLSDRRCYFGLLSAFLGFIVGCSSDRQVPPATRIVQNDIAGGRSDLSQVRSADISILFVGNSHTSMHDVPNLVCEMFRFLHPGKTAYSYFISVVFLEDVARDSRSREEIESRPWTHVVLQAQKESKSGQFKYSQQEGIEIAKLAKAHGAKVIFISEWGLRDVPGHGPRIETIYKEMAAASGARVAPVGRAWDLALSSQPGLALYEVDGNHESALGAFLTASVLFGRLTDESPAALASFRHGGVSETDQKFLVEAAVKALALLP